MSGRRGGGLARLIAGLGRLAAGAHRPAATTAAAGVLLKAMRAELVPHKRTGHALDVLSVLGTAQGVHIIQAGYAKLIPGCELARRNLAAVKGRMQAAAAAAVARVLRG